LTTPPSLITFGAGVVFEDPVAVVVLVDVLVAPPPPSPAPPLPPCGVRASAAVGTAMSVHRIGTHASGRRVRRSVAEKPKSFLAVKLLGRRVLVAYEVS
jgi:hypothetical protein